MSERLPLPAELLRGHTRAGARDDAEVIDLMRLGDRGEYLEAAHQAAQLLETSDDARLTAVYLAGSFVERGPAGLPELFDCVGRLLRPSPDEGPARARVREAAVQWLCRSLISQIAFHTTRRSETWEWWLSELGTDQPTEIAEMSAALMDDFPSSAAALGRISRWAEEKLTPAAARVRKATAVQAPMAAPAAPDPKLSEPAWDAPELDEPEPDGPELVDEPPTDALPDEPGPDLFDTGVPEQIGLDFDPRSGFAEPPGFTESPDFARHLDFARPPVFDPYTPAPHPEPEPPEFSSPALSVLIDKLRGFELLVERGELDKAAIVASDIQSVIEDFDPLIYLPGLFGRYLQLLSKIIAEVEARWNAGDSTARRVLEQFYRADLDRFVNE